MKGSKLQSEPVMALVASVVLAVKQALYAARKDNGLGEDWFQLDLPVTAECVRKHSGTSVEVTMVQSVSALNQHTRYVSKIVGVAHVCHWRGWEHGGCAVKTVY